MPQNKNIDKYLTVPFHLEGFLKRLSDDSIGAAFRAVYARAYGARRDFDDMSDEVGCMAEQIWTEVQTGFDKAQGKSKTNSDNANKRWEKERAKNATASDGMQSDATASDGMQSDAKHADKNRIDKNRENISIAQTEFALEGGSCPSEQKQTTCYSFGQFWEDYGVKQDKKRCEEKFEKLSEADRAAIKLAIPKYKAYCQAKSISMKNPLTFLNGECWNDDFSLQLANIQSMTAPTEPQGGEKPWGWLHEGQQEAANG